MEVNILKPVKSSSLFAEHWAKLQRFRTLGGSGRQIHQGKKRIADSADESVPAEVFGEDILLLRRQKAGVVIGGSIIL